MRTNKSEQLEGFAYWIGGADGISEFGAALPLSKQIGFKMFVYTLSSGAEMVETISMSHEANTIKVQKKIACRKCCARVLANG